MKGRFKSPFAALALAALLLSVVPALQVGMMYRAVEELRAAVATAWEGSHRPEENVKRAIAEACVRNALSCSEASLRYVGSKRTASVEARKRLLLLGVIPLERKFEIFVEFENF